MQRFIHGFISRAFERIAGRHPFCPAPIRKKPQPKVVIAKRLPARIFDTLVNLVQPSYE